MRFIGHTMATPGRTVYESIDAFRAIGLDGMELICRPKTDFDSSIDDARASRMADYAAYNGLPIVTITPYAWDINSADGDLCKAAHTELRRAIHLANLTRAHYVRAYGGRELKEDMQAGFERAVEALREAGEEAGKRDITILVENHPGTMVRTGEATRRLIDAVALPSVRALYDPGNVLHDTDEPWETTFEIQKDILAYVHAKDWDTPGGKRRARNVGEGIVPWAQILRRLVAAGYDGCISFEYEKMWYPEDLDDAEIGVAACLRFVKEALAEADA